MSDKQEPYTYKGYVMVSLATTFTSSEVIEFLNEDGYEAGTPAFCQEMDRRFVPVEEGVYQERDDWDGNRTKASKA